MSPRIPAAVVAVVVLSGCGSSDKAASTASTAKKTAGPLPKSCSTNADGVITKLDAAGNTGAITAGKLGQVAFEPKTAFSRGSLPEGTPVYFTYKKTAGGTATCILKK